MMPQKGVYLCQLVTKRKRRFLQKQNLLTRTLISIKKNSNQSGFSLRSCNISKR